MKIISLFITLFFMLSGCAFSPEDSYSNPGWWGYLESKKSDYDGTYVVRSEPAMITEVNNPFYVGLEWNSKMQEGEYILIVSINGAKNFAFNEPMRIMADGEEILLKSVEAMDAGHVYSHTVVSGVFNQTVVVGNRTNKRFIISLDELIKTLSANHVVFRAMTFNGYIDSVLWPEKEDMSTNWRYKNASLIYFRDSGWKFIKEVGSQKLKNN